MYAAFTGNTARSSLLRGTVPHSAVELVRGSAMLQNLLATLVQCQRAAKTELMSPAQLQRNKRVTQQLQETLRVLLAPAVSTADTAG